MWLALLLPLGVAGNLARPDQIKYEMATLAAHHEPGESKFRRMKDAAGRGLLADVPALVDDWLVEEFLWHGIPDDPWRHPYIYVCPGKHNPSSYDIMSMGPDGREGTDDDITNWQQPNQKP